MDKGRIQQLIDYINALNNSLGKSSLTPEFKQDIQQKIIKASDEIERNFDL